jgi:flavorubredoxin
MEPDHAALIAEMLDKYPNLQLVCSAQAVKMLPNFFDGVNFEGRVRVVKRATHSNWGTTRCTSSRLQWCIGLKSSLRMR